MANHNGHLPMMSGLRFPTPSRGRRGRTWDHSALGVHNYVQQRTADGDGGEQRIDDTNRQNEGEPFDRTGAERVQNGTRDQRGDVAVADGRPGSRESGVDGGVEGLAAFSSSFILSKIRMLASTAIPMDRMNPAIPGSVSVNPNHVPNRRNTVNVTAV